MKVMLRAPDGKLLFTEVKDGVESIEVPGIKPTVALAKVESVSRDSILKRNLETVRYKNTHKILDIPNEGFCVVFKAIQKG